MWLYKLKFAFYVFKRIITMDKAAFIALLSSLDTAAADAKTAADAYVASHGPQDFAEFAPAVQTAIDNINALKTELGG